MHTDTHAHTHLYILSLYMALEVALLLYWCASLFILMTLCPERHITYKNACVTNTFYAV